MEPGAREREREWFRLTCTRGKSNTCARYIWAWRNGMAPRHGACSFSFSEPLLFICKQKQWWLWEREWAPVMQTSNTTTIWAERWRSLGSEKAVAFGPGTCLRSMQEISTLLRFFHYQNKQGKKSSCGKRTIRSCYSLSVHKVWASPQTTKDISKPQKNSPVRVNKNISKVTFSICLVN